MREPDICLLVIERIFLTKKDFFVQFFKLNFLLSFILYYKLSNDMTSSSRVPFDDVIKQSFGQLLDQQFDNMFVDLATREKRNEPILTNMKNNTSSYGTII